MIRQVFAGVALMAAFAAHGETLAEAWQLALEHDGVLAAARLDTEAAQLESAAARAARWPTLTASGSFVQFDAAPRLGVTELVDHDNTLTGGLMLNMPLYTGGRISNTIGASAAGQRAREADETRAVQDTRLAVAQAYAEVLRAGRALAVADANVASLAGYRDEVASMFGRELVPRNDLLAADVALANARQTRIRTANAVQLARAGYNRRLGQPLDREVTLEPRLPPLAGDIGHEAVEPLIVRALALRGELGALEAQASAAGHLARAELARVRPQVSLGGGYSYLENSVLDREQFAVATLGVSWALFDGGVARRKSASLRRTQRALEMRRTDLESLVALEVHEAWLGLHEARSRVDATAGAVTQAEENLRITRLQYLAGLVTTTRVLEAESLRTMSRGNHDDAELDADLAVYRLARAVGEL